MPTPTTRVYFDHVVRCLYGIPQCDSQGIVALTDEQNTLPANSLMLGQTSAAAPSRARSCPPLRKSMPASSPSGTIAWRRNASCVQPAHPVYLPPPISADAEIHSLSLTRTTAHWHPSSALRSRCLFLAFFLFVRPLAALLSFLVLTIWFPPICSFRF